MSKRALDLARLAADERTPIHEREAAALQLAKIVARDGMPAGGATPDDFGPRHGSVRQQREIDELRADLAALRCQHEHLGAIARESGARVIELEADKAELERRLRSGRAPAPAAPRIPEWLAGDWVLDRYSFEYQHESRRYGGGMDGSYYQPRRDTRLVIELLGEQSALRDLVERLQKPDATPPGDPVGETNRRLANAGVGARVVGVLGGRVVVEDV